jgi:hypothetical protein
MVYASGKAQEDQAESILRAHGATPVGFLNTEAPALPGRHVVVEYAYQPAARRCNMRSKQSRIRKPAAVYCMASAKRNTVFICYARKDSKFLSELHEHLAPYIRLADITVWDDTRLRGGDEWRAEIQKALTSAQVAICLVSHSFRASTFIAQNELPPLLRATKSKGLVILPVIVGTCDFQETELAGVQAINDPHRPLRGLTPEKRNVEWVKVVRRVRDVLHDRSTRPDPPPDTEGQTHEVMVNRLGDRRQPAASHGLAPRWSGGLLSGLQPSFRFQLPHAEHQRGQVQLPRLP